MCSRVWKRHILSSLQQTTSCMQLSRAPVSLSFEILIYPHPHTSLNCHLVFSSLPSSSSPKKTHHPVETSETRNPFSSWTTTDSLFRQFSSALQEILNCMWDHLVIQLWPIKFSLAVFKFIHFISYFFLFSYLTYRIWIREFHSNERVCVDYSRLKFHRIIHSHHFD